MCGTAVLRPLNTAFYPGPKANKINLPTCRIYICLKDNRVEDDGEYTCIISNSFGSISHTIQVRFPPLVSNAPELVELELLWGAAIILGAGIILGSRNYFILGSRNYHFRLRSRNTGSKRHWAEIK